MKRFLSLGLIIAANLYVVAVPAADTKKADRLRIATSANLAEENQASADTAGDTLRKFIKTETGLESDNDTTLDYIRIAEMLSKDELDVAVLQGYEFAWMHAQNQKLKPLAVAVNEKAYLYACVLVRKDSKIKDFNDLKGKTVAVTRGTPFLQVYVDGECKRREATAETYFTKVTHPDNAEDAVDDVVDKKVDAAVLQQVSLDAYKQRKPGRFSVISEAAHSSAFPPTVIVFKDGALDPGKRKRFEDSLLGAHKKQQGKEMLTLFKLTSFQKAPADLEKVLAETAKAYPPPKTDTK
jgi:ABC-type phosphate/phosphonate transport system substrate-binding protein